MALVRLQPFREIDTLQREMNRIFNRMSFPENLEDVGTVFVPPAEISQTAEAVHLKLEIPGIEAKDLDVQVTAEAVSISGERKSETHAEEDSMMRTEFRYGKFQRVIPLPARIENTKVEAEYKDGILKLVLPKAEEEKNKVIKVNLG